MSHSELLNEEFASLNATRDLMEEHFARWIPILGLDTWQRVTVCYNAHLAKEKPDSCASTDVQWEYMTARINVWLPNAADLPKEQLQYVVVHELCHLLVNEMRGDPARQYTLADLEHEERVVTTLAMAFLRTACAYEAKSEGEETL